MTDDIAAGVVCLPHGWGHDKDGTRLSRGPRARRGEQQRAGPRPPGRRALRQRRGQRDPRRGRPGLSADPRYRRAPCGSGPGGARSRCWPWWSRSCRRPPTARSATAGRGGQRRSRSSTSAPGWVCPGTHSWDLVVDQVDADGVARPGDRRPRPGADPAQPPARAGGRLHPEHVRSPRLRGRRRRRQRPVPTSTARRARSTATPSGGTASSSRRRRAPGPSTPRSTASSTASAGAPHDVRGPRPRGNVDLFVGNEVGRTDGEVVGQPHLPQRCRPPMTMRRLGPIGDKGAVCVQAVDQDRDGWQDLLLCGGSNQPGQVNTGATQPPRTCSATGRRRAADASWSTWPPTLGIAVNGVRRRPPGPAQRRRDPRPRGRGQPAG